MILSNLAKQPMHRTVVLRELSPNEYKRLDEVHFFLILNQLHSSKQIGQAPMGTTIPKMLASLLRLDPEVIDYAYTTLTTPGHTPSNDEIVIMLRMNKVSAAKSIFTPETYYKALKRWKAEGQQELKRSISDLQYGHIKKFITGYSAFMGKRNVLANIGKRK